MIQTIDHGPVRELRFDRPPANALSPDFIAALRAAVEAAPGAGAGAVVLSGAPGIFSGGLDVPHLITLDREGILDAWREFYALLRSLAASRVPIAAAITGHSPAGGAVMAIFCDYRIMAEGNFKIGFNEVQIGIPMPPSLYWGVRRLVGSRQAERLCVGGLLFPPAEALRIGLVDELASPEQVVPRAIELCQSLLALPPGAMAATRRLARSGMASLFTEGTEDELAGLTEEWFSEETQGALRALVDRLKKK